MRKIINKKLGDGLLERGVITEEQLQEALAVQSKKGGLIGEVLVALGFVSEIEIAQTLTAIYGFPYLPLNNYEINSDIIAVVPARVARQYVLIPVDKFGANITLAMADPLNIQAIEDIEMISGCNVQTFISTASDIKAAIDRYYK